MADPLIAPRSREMKCQDEELLTVVCMSICIPRSDIHLQVRTNRPVSIL
jgi:hypothetical protein